MDQNVLERILDGSMEPTDLPLETLRQITDNFSRNRIIGEGGFGTVYKGVLPNGNVAVKKIMSSMTIDEKLFHREVNSLMEVNHQNVVKFLGLCSHTVHTPLKNPEGRGYILAEKRERILCFEYISNGSLDKHITDELRGLEWNTRYRVIKGICTGLYYLHMEKGILHMDLKPANILLDNQMVPKITDFGLSRHAENSQTMSENQFSSPGYSAPENMFGRGRMSMKSDIYGLGTIIIELVTGKNGIPDDNNNILRRWRHRWNKSVTNTPPAYEKQIIRCIEIGIMCQSVDPYKRPFISDIMIFFGEIECTNNDISNVVDEPTIGQLNSDSWKDDMLRVEPLELTFSNCVNKNNLMPSSCSLELSNNTDGFIAFSIQTTSPLTYCVDPNNDIVPPQSKLSVDITLREATKDHDKEVSQYNSKQYSEQFIVRSIKVTEGFATKDINQDMFDKGKDVDEVYLAVISEAQLQVPSCILLSEEPCEEVIPSHAEYSKELPLIVHPSELRFPFEPNKFIKCSLHLSNKMDKPVIFRLMMKNVECTSYLLFWKRKTGYLKMLPLYGIVPPRSTYTLVLAAQGMEELPKETHIDLILQNSITGNNIYKFRNDDACYQFFGELKDGEDALNEVTLQALCLCAPIGQTINEIIPMVHTTCPVKSLDVHPTEPWIIMSFSTEVEIWNYETQARRIMKLFKVSSYYRIVSSIKFIARKRWFLVGDFGGYIHVCDYGTELQRTIIKSFKCSDYPIESFAIHPTKPYALSASHYEINLWDWDKDWRRIQKFENHSWFVPIIRHVMFHPRDHDIFASASEDYTVKVWNIDSPDASYTLSGHSNKVTCLDFFTRDDQVYLVSCSDDNTAKVWDMKEKTCVHTIEASMSQLTYVISLSDRPCLLAGSEDGLVYMWSSSDFRLERTFSIAPNNWRNSVQVASLACLEGGKRFAVNHPGRITIIDIDNEELSC
ncbi:hypothetical protein ACQ4PT_065172 [Festuca glaucescens]